MTTKQFKRAAAAQGLSVTGLRKQRKSASRRTANVSATAPQTLQTPLTATTATNGNSYNAVNQAAVAQHHHHNNGDGDDVPRADETNCVKTYRKTILTTALNHLLLDNPEHQVYAHHFEQAVTLSGGKKKDADELDTLLAALHNQAMVLEWDEDAAEVADHRVQAYWLACQTEPLAERIKSAQDVMVVIRTLIRQVRAKPAESYDDPDSVLSVCKKIVQSFVEKPSNEPEPQAHEPEAGPPDEEPKIEISALTKRVKHAEECLKYWWITNKTSENASRRDRQHLEALFQEPEDLYIGYVMSDLKISAEDEGLKFDPVSGYITARDYWDGLPGRIRRTWYERLGALLAGDMTILTKFEFDMDVKGRFGRPKKEGRDNGASNSANKDDAGASKGVGVDGMKVKKEDEDNTSGVQAFQPANWQRNLTVRTTPKPEATVFNPPREPKALRALSASTRLRAPELSVYAPENVATVLAAPSIYGSSAAFNAFVHGTNDRWTNPFAQSTAPGLSAPVPPGRRGNLSAAWQNYDGSKGKRPAPQNIGIAPVDEGNADTQLQWSPTRGIRPK